MDSESIMNKLREEKAHIDTSQNRKTGSLAEFVQEQSKDFHLIRSTFTKFDAPIPKLWKDENVFKRADGHTFPDQIQSRSNIKTQLIRFYNFYFSGILPGETRAESVVFPVLASLATPVPGPNQINFFFSYSKWFSDQKSFFDYPSRTSETEESLDIDHYRLSQGGDQLRRVQEGLLCLDITELGKYTFSKAIKYILPSFDKGPVTRDQTRLLAVSGYLALICYRAIVKNKLQMTKAFNKRTVVNHLTKLADWPEESGYAPPCDAALEILSRDFDKKMPSCQIMTSMILGQWRIHQRLGNDLFTSILHAGFLTYTAGTGMGLFEYMVIACDILGCRPIDLFETTLFNKSQNSWELLLDAGAKYFSNTNTAVLIWWARLVDDAYFCDFACRHHPFLSGIFAAVIDLKQGNGSMQNAAWYRQNRAWADLGYDIGIHIPEFIQPTNPRGLLSKSNKLHT